MKIANKIIALMAVAMVFASCSKDDDVNNVPSQKEIETKIVGKWKKMKQDGKDVATNQRTIWLFNNDGKGTLSVADHKEGDDRFIWDNKESVQYSVQGNVVYIISPSVERTSTIPSISDSQMTMHVTKVLSHGIGIKADYVGEYSKVTADYSKDIIGLWEGVEMTGYETYGNAEHRILYNADGTYVYFVKSGDDWVPSSNVDNEYNVDGDWLATRWRPEAGADYNYEWWDIDEIKDGMMKWSALREKEDGTRFTTTFTWRKVELPSQHEIETKIIGKWKMVETRGEKVPTDYRTVTTYQANGKETVSTAKTHEMVGFVWSNTDPLSYQIKDNHMEETKLSNGMTLYSNIISITDNRFEKVVNKVTFSDGKVSEPHESTVFTKVTVDYSQDIIGMWEGVEMTGYETYGNAEARIEYRADGTYTYYVKDGEKWIPSTNADNEYNVDGDWLATRWRPEAGADYNYEWWDIDEIKDGMMKWSALREKEDGTRFNTTFTWRKVELPSQQEIEAKIVGKWKRDKCNGVDILTNDKHIDTYAPDGVLIGSMSKEKDGVWNWGNKVKMNYSVEGNILHRKSSMIESWTEVSYIDNATMTELSNDRIFVYLRVTADYSQDIIGMWEGVEMTGYETYGNAEHRILYNADGTYVYFVKSGDDWVPSSNVDNEYNVDGDWLATRWRPEAGADYNYEWWDIDEIKDGMMKWSALREKEDGTRFNTTFTWRKVK